MSTPHVASFFFFFFNDTATTEIYTLSLHDALPISPERGIQGEACIESSPCNVGTRSEEHTSELQSLRHLVCRLLLEKKKRGDGMVKLLHLHDAHEAGHGVSAFVAHWIRA